ncbi:hypothetical protein C1646_677451 [Rhizophagus diaphanus]|nr:hypothetical protein C1646_677451 [Rhizophagus diaphanus] [Rhizophagus sp. MUCL 43196]
MNQSDYAHNSNFTETIERTSSNVPSYASLVIRRRNNRRFVYNYKYKDCFFKKKNIGVALLSPVCGSFSLLGHEILICQFSGNGSFDSLLDFGCPFLLKMKSFRYETNMKIKDPQVTLKDSETL